MAAASFFTSLHLFDLRTPLLQEPVTALQNQIVASLVPQGCDVCNPPEVADLSLFLVTVRSRSANASSTYRLPLTDKYRQLATYTFTSKWARRVTRHKQTHSAAEQQESQTASVHYTIIQAIHSYTQMQRHSNLTHYTTLALI